MRHPIEFFFNNKIRFCTPLTKRIVDDYNISIIVYFNNPHARFNFRDSSTVDLDNSPIFSIIEHTSRQSGRIVFAFKEDSESSRDYHALFATREEYSLCPNSIHLDESELLFFSNTFCDVTEQCVRILKDTDTSNLVAYSEDIFKIAHHIENFRLSKNTNTTITNYQSDEYSNDH